MSAVYHPWLLDTSMHASAMPRKSRVSRPQRMLRLRGSAMPAAYPWRRRAGRGCSGRGGSRGPAELRAAAAAGTEGASVAGPRPPALAAPRHPGRRRRARRGRGARRCCRSPCARSGGLVDRAAGPTSTGARSRPRRSTAAPGGRRSRPRRRPATCCPARCRSPATRAGRRPPAPPTSSSAATAPTRPLRAHHRAVLRRPVHRLPPPLRGDRRSRAHRLGDGDAADAWTGKGSAYRWFGPLSLTRGC